MNRSITLIERWNALPPEERARRIAMLRKGYNSQKTQAKMKKLAKERGKPIVCLETGEVYESVSAAAEKLGIPQSNLSSVCNGHRQTCGGNHFRFLEENE